jgi:hypothetical protein
MRARGLTLAVFFSSALAPAFAGDLAELPADQPGFQAKLGTYIRPGARLADAQRLLEGDRFRCEMGIDAKGSFLWCDRTDGSPISSAQRRYQVVLRTDGATITSVKASMGLIGT